MSKFLVEILVPLAGPDGQPFANSMFEDLARRLTGHFGGVTAFLRSPADGRWQRGERIERDDIIVLEVMADDLDRDWWSDLRCDLMQHLAQDDIIIRSHKVELLK